MLCSRASRGAPILILDEATSNLDGQSDDAIQSLLREEFVSRTVLTIAHRLATVIDYDRILVLGGGKLVEEGKPVDLLESESVLRSMSQALGAQGEKALLDKARTTTH